MHTTAWLLLALPLLGFAINGLLGPRLGKAAVSLVGPGVILAAFVVALQAWAALQGAAPTCAAYRCDEVYYTWASVGTFHLDFGLLIDPLSAVMLLVVTGVGFLIHVYSVGYMRDDPHFSRFFAYMNIFIFSMLLLVLADNFLFLLVGWGLVGLSSYLLIGFWLERPSAVAAARKAFVMNVIGDAGLMIGLFLLFKTFGTLAYDPIFNAAQNFRSDDLTITTICLFLLVGAFAKSAQIPLHTWLPDAMEGPTPVSALIHAATMVTAGVYLVCRCHPLFLVSPFALGTVAVIGTITAIYAATIGTAQYDIKRVLAYSTVSQLGYMVFAVGAGAYVPAIFHLLTHAFFKALLFLAAGSVIHGMEAVYGHDPLKTQDLRAMGGLRRSMPTTYWTFLIGGMALAGVPLTAGFFSKDEILVGAWHAGYPLVAIVGWFVAFLTAFYTFRMIFLTFHGTSRFGETGQTPHESPRIITLPLIALAIPAALIGLVVGLPPDEGAIHRWLEPIFTLPGVAALPHELPSTALTWGGFAASTVLSLGGIALAYAMYLSGAINPATIGARFAPVYRFLVHRWYVDELYNATIVHPLAAFSRFLWRWVDIGFIDGIVNDLGWLIGAIAQRLRRVQTGVVSNYALAIVLGTVIIVGVYLIFGPSFLGR